MNNNNDATLLVNKALHRRFKMLCVKLGRPMRPEVERLIETYLLDPPVNTDSIIVFLERPSETGHPKEILKVIGEGDRAKELVG